MNSDGPTNPRVTIAVTRQLNQLRLKAPNGVKVIINDADIFDIQAEVQGPTQTPYEGGVFKFKLILPNDFPQTPPKGYFQTKIFHPNVSEKGEICVNTLKKDWNHQNWSFYNIFEVIKCLLIIPFPESALNEEAGKLFMEDYDSYFKYAKIMTDVHAKLHKPFNKMEIEHVSQQLKQPSQNFQTLKDEHPLLITLNEQGHLVYPSQQVVHQNQQPVYQNQQPVYQNQQPVHPSQQNYNHNASQQYFQPTTLLNPTQNNQFNPIVTNILNNSPYRDSNKPQLFNPVMSNSASNSQLTLLNGSHFQKNQNQENLQQQTNSTFVTVQNQGSFNMLQEEPLCVLSKNNGYNSSTTSLGQTTNNMQKQYQQQYNKNNLLLNLTFNNCLAASAEQSSSCSLTTNMNTHAHSGKQQNEKKWLKRI